MFWWNTVCLYIYIKSMGGLGQEVGKDLLPYIYRCSQLVREIQLGQSDTWIHVMSSLKTELWQVGICTAYVGVGEELNMVSKWYTLPSVSKSSPLFSLVTQSQVLYTWIGICNDLSMGLHNEQLHMVVKVPPSHCLTQSYNGWVGGSKEL